VRDVKQGTKPYHQLGKKTPFRALHVRYGTLSIPEALPEVFLTVRAEPSYLTAADSCTHLFSGCEERYLFNLRVKVLLLPGSGGGESPQLQEEVLSDEGERERRTVESGLRFLEKVEDLVLRYHLLKKVEGGFLRT